MLVLGVLVLNSSHLVDVECSACSMHNAYTVQYVVYDGIQLLYQYCGHGLHCLRKRSSTQYAVLQYSLVLRVYDGTSIMFLICSNISIFPSTRYYVLVLMSYSSIV